jgi:hypothetical protein
MLKLSNDISGACLQNLRYIVIPFSNLKTKKERNLEQKEKRILLSLQLAWNHLNWMAFYNIYYFGTYILDFDSIAYDFKFSHV